MKLKKIKTIAIVSAITATAVIVPTIAITNINNNNTKVVNSGLSQSNPSNLIRNTEFNPNLQSSFINTNQLNFFNPFQGFTTSSYNSTDSKIPSKNIKNIVDIANNVSIVVPKGLTIAAWKEVAYKNGVNGTQQGGQIHSSGNIGGIEFLLNNHAWYGSPYITWSYSADMSLTSVDTPEPLGQNFIYIRVFSSESNAWFGIRVMGFAPNYPGTISKYNPSDNIPSKNINDVADIFNNLSIIVPEGLTIDAWKQAAYKQGINGTLKPNYINDNGNIGGIQFLLDGQAWNDEPQIDWSYTSEMSFTTIKTPEPFGQSYIYIRVYPAGSSSLFGIKVTGFTPTYPGRISKYNSSLNLPSKNGDKTNFISDNISVVVPNDLTIDAWKQAAYKQGIDGTLQGAKINSSGSVGGIQFLLKDKVWAGEPFITWSYTPDMSPATIHSPEPFGQDFVYIRVFPFGSYAWFGIEVTGFMPNYPGTTSRYKASLNLPSKNINDIPISNHISVVVPKGLTIAAWKQAAYKQGINGTQQGGNINGSGNIGGIQFLLNGKEAWAGEPYITWSYAPDMSSTTIQSPEHHGQDAIYIRVFPFNGDAWFEIEVTGFLTIYSS